MPYVITCGEEGVQINEGTRLSIVGSGVKFEYFSEIVKVLKDLIKDDLRIAACSRNDWIKEKLELSDWEQADASSQQHVEALADREELLYSGFLKFVDPRQLKHDIKGHMVRPPKIHVANKICFTLAGGEQVYNLGQYQISAEWVSSVSKKVAKAAIKEQVNFYTKLAGRELPVEFEMKGELGEKLAEKNKKVLESLGYKGTVIEREG